MQIRGTHWTKHWVLRVNAKLQALYQVLSSELSMGLRLLLIALTFVTINANGLHDQIKWPIFLARSSTCRYYLCTRITSDNRLREII